MAICTNNFFSRISVDRSLQSTYKSSNANGFSGLEDVASEVQALGLILLLAFPTIWAINSAVEYTSNRFISFMKKEHSEPIVAAEPSVNAEPEPSVAAEPSVNNAEPKPSVAAEPSVNNGEPKPSVAAEPSVNNAEPKPSVAAESSVNNAEPKPSVAAKPSVNAEPKISSMRKVYNFVKGIFHKITAWFNILAWFNFSKKNVVNQNENKGLDANLKSSLSKGDAKETTPKTVASH